MADYWAKIYIEILDDPKMATMPDRLWRRTIELFLLAKKFNKEGHLPETKQLAWLLRMQTDDLDLDLRQIASTGIIQAESGGWFVVKFSQRQAAVPADERMRQMRNRNQKQQYYGNVTTELRNVTQNTDNREQNTETDTEPTLDYFLSHLDGLIGCPIGGHSDVDTAEIMFAEFGYPRVKKAADWAKEKGMQPMRTALRSMNTALKNGGFHEESVMATQNAPEIR